MIPPTRSPLLFDEYVLMIEARQQPAHQRHTRRRIAITQKRWRRKTFLYGRSVAHHNRTNTNDFSNYDLLHQTVGLSAS